MRLQNRAVGIISHPESNRITTGKDAQHADPTFPPSSRRTESAATSRRQIELTEQIVQRRLVVSEFPGHPAEKTIETENRAEFSIASVLPPSAAAETSPSEAIAQRAPSPQFAAGASSPPLHQQRRAAAAYAAGSGAANTPPKKSIDLVI